MCGICGAIGYKEEYSGLGHLKDLEQMQAIDLKYWLPGDILQKVDKMSMAHSLELRVPFLDREVFRVASRIPHKIKTKNYTTKYALRRVACVFWGKMRKTAEVEGLEMSTMAEPRLLVIEDEKSLADILEYHFTKEGFQVKSAYNGADGIRLVKEYEPQLVLLDWMLPDLSGVDVCKMLTEQYNIPIIMLTARGTVDDKVCGLSSGADDYITKPFELREVTARVKTILRRMEKTQTLQNKIHIGHVVILEQERIVFMNDEQVELTVKEFDLLLWLIKHPRKTFTRDSLLTEIWGYDFLGGTRTVDVHIHRLREKLDLADRILTVFGVGYKYVPK